MSGSARSFYKLFSVGLQDRLPFHRLNLNIWMAGKGLLFTNKDEAMFLVKSRGCQVICDTSRNISLNPLVMASDLTAFTKHSATPNSRDSGSTPHRDQIVPICLAHTCTNYSYRFIILKCQPKFWLGF